MYQNNCLRPPSSAPPAVENIQEIDFSHLDRILETEKSDNQKESWNKLGRAVKQQKLHIFAETYGRNHGFSAKMVKVLKTFFTDSLVRGKLTKTREVTYNRATGAVENVVGLYFHGSTKSFTLRNTDSKHVSTLKSLTPKRTSLSETPAAAAAEEEESGDDAGGAAGEETDS